MASVDKFSLYGRTRTGEIKVWTVWATNNPATVYREWGLLNGQKMVTSEVMTSRGVPHTKAFKTPELVAVEQMKRLILEREEAGMVRDIKDLPDSVHADGIKFDFANLPLSFQPAKPVQKVTRAEVERWEAAGNVMIQRKRDGQRVYVTIDEHRVVNIFTRKIEKITANVPNLVAAIESLRLPPLTMLDGELLIEDADGTDNFRALRSVSGSKPDNARIAEREWRPFIMFFDVLYYDGDETFKSWYGFRYQTLKKALQVNDLEGYAAHAIRLPDDVGSLANGENNVSAHNWEGLVVWRTDQPTHVRLDGKESRTNCYKWKPIFTGDFVATGWEHGKGRLSNLAGVLNLAEYVNGTLVSIGKVGSGFDDATRVEAMSWKYPCVVEIEYDKQERDTGALRFPVFLRKRDDKPLKECVRGSNE